MGAIVPSLCGDTCDPWNDIDETCIDGTDGLGFAEPGAWESPHPARGPLGTSTHGAGPQPSAWVWGCAPGWSSAWTFGRAVSVRYI